MKRINLLYWIFNGLLAALMIFSGIPNILSTPESVQLVTDHLRFPLFFIPFLGVAKVLGAIVILLPGFPRLKEWVYAGFTYDLVAATYASICVGDPASGWLWMSLFFALLAATYISHHRRLKARVQAA